MHTIELHDLPDTKGRPVVHRFSFPGDWKELTGDQLGRVAMLITAPVPEAELRFRLLRSLAGIPKKLFVRSAMEDLLGEATDLLPQLDAFFPKYGKPVVFERSLMPLLEHDGRRWEGPRDNLGNFNVLQLSFCDHLLADVQHGAPKALNNLLGGLYVPEGSEWDNDGIEERAQQLASLPLATRLGAGMNYSALRNGLAERYPRTFGKRKTEEGEDYGIDGLLEALAGEKFGTVDQVGGMPVHPALVHSERQLQMAEEMEANTART